MFDLKNIVIRRWGKEESRELSSRLKVPNMEGIAVYPEFILDKFNEHLELRWWYSDKSKLDKLHSKVRQLLGDLEVEWGEWTAVKRDGPHAGTVFAYLDVKVDREYEEEMKNFWNHILGTNPANVSGTNPTKNCCEEAAQKGQPFCDCEIPF